MSIICESSRLALWADLHKTAMNERIANNQIELGQGRKVT